MPPIRRRSSISKGQPLAANAERLVKALDFLGAPMPADTAQGARESNRGQGREEAAGGARQARPVRREHQPRVAREGRARPGRGEASASRLHAGARQGRQREHGQEAAADRAARRRATGYSGSGDKNPKDDPKIVERFLHVEMFTAPPMTAGPQRPQGRVRHRPRSTAARPASARRPSASTSARGPRTSASAARRPVLFDVQPGDPGEARRHGLRRQADRSAASRSRDAAGHVYPAASRSGSRPTSSSRSRSIGPTAAPCCCRRASSRWSTAADRSTG